MKRSKKFVQDICCIVGHDYAGTWGCQRCGSFRFHSHISYTMFPVEKQSKFKLGQPIYVDTSGRATTGGSCAAGVAVTPVPSSGNIIVKANEA